jgi:hypothetical protein
MRIVAPLLLFFLLFAAGQVAAQQPAGYDNVRIWTNFAEFTVADDSRKIVEERGVTFSTSTPVELSFDVLVNPAGTVDFVRIPRCQSELAEYRKGGADALYGFQFEPMASATEATWVKVRMRVQPEEALNPQAR